LRVALISPKWNKKPNDYPPLGLGYLGTVLEAHGHEVGIFDFGLSPTRALDLEVDDVCAFQPQIVGITAMTVLYHSALDTAALLKARLGRPIVLGGPHATLFPERVLDEAPAIDYVIRGEGEESLLELVTALESRVTDLGGILGLSYRAHGQVVSNADRELIGELDTLPFPARHLFEIDRYGLRTPEGAPMITVLSSRGCPYNCAYCFKGIVGRTYRQRSPENIVRELKQVMSTYGVHDFYFIDDLFTLDVKRLEQITELFVAEGLDIRWQCLARVDRVSEALLRKMQAAGCRRVQYGIESGNQEILKRIGKGFTLAQVTDAVRWTKTAGIHTKGYFMLGLPGDTDRTMRETIDFAVALGLDEAMFSLTTPFPGTRLWDELVRKRPETTYSLDFSRAYYYANAGEEVIPFLNVSEVSDVSLARWMSRAHQALEQGRARELYDSAFGPTLGRVLWGLASVAPIRAVGRWLIRLGLFKRFAGLRARMARAW